MCHDYYKYGQAHNNFYNSIRIVPMIILIIVFIMCYDYYNFAQTLIVFIMCHDYYKYGQALITTFIIVFVLCHDYSNNSIHNVTLVLNMYKR